jgi:hypothetical protein
MIGFNTLIAKEKYRINAEARSGFEYFKKESLQKAFGIGGEIETKLDLPKNFYLTVSLFGMDDLGLNPSNRKKVYENFFGAKKNGFVFLNKGYLTYKNEKFLIQAGRIELDTPHFDTDDISFVSNSFEGINIKEKVGNYTYSLGYIRKMAGWDSGGKIEKFKKLNTIIDSKKNSNGAFFGGIGYEKNNFLFNLWGYRILEIADIVYLEIIKEVSFKDNTLSMGIQIDKGKNVSDYWMNKIDSQTLGILFSVANEKTNLGIEYNREFGKTGSMFSYGGGPFFTSMEIETIDSIENKNSYSYALEGVYNIDRNMQIGSKIGKFCASSKTVYNKIEYDIFLNLNFPKNYNFHTVFVFIDDKNDRNTFYCKAIFKKRFSLY